MRSPGEGWVPTPPGAAVGRGVQRTGPQVVVGTDVNLQNRPASQASEAFSTSDRQASRRWQRC